ncbi:DUF2711 family protein [Roseibium sp.]|uniref:DUF2711 family protein n=1 Tax=Roseibium sp. TaxID=1936156 RepID=UPI003A984EDD
MRLSDFYKDVIGLSSTGDPYLSGFGANFDFAFVWFKPFQRISSARVTDFQPWVNVQLRRSDGRPYQELERLLLDEGEIWSWDYVAKQMELKNIGEVEIAESSTWGHLTEEYRRPDLAKKIIDFQEIHNLEEIHDNILESYELRYIYQLLKDAGFDHIIQFDIAWGDEDLKNQKYALAEAPDFVQLPRTQYCSNSNVDFAITTYFGDFHAVIHGPNKLADAIRRSSIFEGFFCNELTVCDWYFDVENQMGERKYIAPPH